VREFIRPRQILKGHFIALINFRRQKSHHQHPKKLPTATECSWKNQAKVATITFQKLAAAVGKSFL